MRSAALVRKLVRMLASTRRLSPAALAAAATLAAHAAPATPVPPLVGASGPVVSGYVVPDGLTRLALRDLDGDGRRDLLIVDPAGLAWRRLREDGSFSPADDGALAWPSPTVGWNVADLDADGRTEIGRASCRERVWIPV